MCGTISVILTPGMVRQEDDECVVSLGDRETLIQNNDKNSKPIKRLPRRVVALHEEEVKSLALMAPAGEDKGYTAH